MKNLKVGRTKVKKVRYPEKPKKAANAYAIYFRERMEEIREERSVQEQE